MHRLRHTMREQLAPLRTPLLPLLAAGLVLAAWAGDAQRITQAVSVAVVPLADHSRAKKQLISESATDAVALALDESGEYTVTPKADTLRELEALGVHVADLFRFTISNEQMVRLGQRLRVDKVAGGSVDELSIDARSGRCRCVLTVRLMDIVTEEYLDGATVEYTTSPVPGWRGEEADVINEALRSAAEEAVRKIITSRKPRGNVDMVDQTGTVMVNLGSRDGVQVGMELLVVRGIWNAVEEKVVLRKIGRIRVKRLELNNCYCVVVSGATPRTGDKCYVMYHPVQRAAAIARSERQRRYITILAAVGTLFGIYATATGPDNQSPPGAQAYLTQSAPGAEPRILVRPSGGRIPDPEDTKAWLVYRGETRGFPAEADNRNHLVAAIRGSHLAQYEDEPTRALNITFSMEFQYINEEGDQEDASVDITYNHMELVAGRTYYYKLRRIVDPGRVRIPIADTNQEEEEPADVEFEVDPVDALGEESAAAGPVTFFYPPVLQEPSNGNLAVNPDPSQEPTVFTWTPSVGADEYQVMIYTNPSGQGTPVKVSPVQTYTGNGDTMEWKLTTRLQPETTYYWFVGARKRGEALPLVYSLGNRRGWIMSEPFMFRTAPSPPPAPASAGPTDGGRARPAGRPGWWQETRGSRR